jgi:hypothetical protein
LSARFGLRGIIVRRNFCRHHQPSVGLIDVDPISVRCHVDLGFELPLFERVEEHGVVLGSVALDFACSLCGNCRGQGSPLMSFSLVVFF